MWCRRRTGNGDYCLCGRISARSRNEAEKKAAERMQKNGASAYKLEDASDAAISAYYQDRAASGQAALTAHR